MILLLDDLEAFNCRKEDVEREGVKIYDFLNKQREIKFISFF